jgi:hypothetical protein
VDFSGSKLHAFVSPERASPQFLEGELNSRGFGPVAIKLILPSLEDVFIATVRKAG